MAFGPFLLLDKSTFQELGFECWQYASRYYQHLVSPILLRELTSDIAKEKKGKSDAELKRTVTHLAAKAKSPQTHVLPEAQKMAGGELLGHSPVPMNGQQIPREFGVAVDVPGLGLGICYNEHPMMQILRRWANGTFSEEYKQKAAAIREEDSSVSLEVLFKEVEAQIPKPKFASLEDMVAWLDNVYFVSHTPRQQLLRVARHVLENKPGLIGAVMKRWRQMNRPSLRDFAPYAWYFYRVDIIHFFSLLCGFVSKSKHGKAHLDVQYLYYLPFCRIFSSNDKDLLKLVPFFIRNDQLLVSKENLKTDLQSISQYFSKLSEEDTREFYLEFGPYPPDLDSSFTAMVWKRFMRARRSREGELSKPTPEDSERIRKELKAIEEAMAQNPLKGSI